MTACHTPIFSVSILRPVRKTLHKLLKQQQKQRSRFFLTYFTITWNMFSPHVFHCKIFLPIVPNIWINTVNITIYKITLDEMYGKK